MAKSGLAQRIMIDASHANSSKPENQPLVAEDVARQMEAGDARLVGMMIESHLLGGRQDMVPGTPLVSPEHHRRLHRLGCVGGRAGTPGPGGARTPPRR